MGVTLKMDILCLEFINSWWNINHRLFKDPLTDQECMDDFCEKWNLPHVDVSNTENVDALLKLRSFLNGVGTELCKTKKVSDKNIDKLNQYLFSQKLHKELKLENGEYQLHTIPEQFNISWITYQIVLSFANLLTQYNTEKIKLCENPDCGWIFYDESKGTTRKWCDNTCASLMKVRRFREAKKQAENKTTNIQGA